MLCADFFQWRKRLLLKLRAADRNFADLKAHANLCTSAIWPVMQEYKSVRWRVKNWLAGNPPQPHDDAISSHVYETKGFLSESTTSATPTHTVTLGVIYSKTSRCMQMRSTRLLNSWSLSSTLEKTHKNCLKQKWRELKVIFIFWSLSDNFPLKYFWQRRNINEHGGIRNEFCSGAILLTSSTFLLIFHRCISTKVYIRS